MANKMYMPRLDPTMTEGILSKWRKKEGEPIKAGEAVFEVTTDLLTKEIRSEWDGVLLRQYCREGSEVRCREMVAEIGEAGEIPSELEPPAPLPPVEIGTEFTLASPLARKTAKEKGIVLSAVAPASQKGIVAADLENMAAETRLSIGIAPVETENKTEAPSIAVLLPEPEITAVPERKTETAPKKEERNEPCRQAPVYKICVDATAATELAERVAPLLGAPWNDQLDIAELAVFAAMRILKKISCNEKIGYAVHRNNKTIYVEIKQGTECSLSEVCHEIQRQETEAESSPAGSREEFTFCIISLAAYGITDFVPALHGEEKAALGICAPLNGGNSVQLALTAQEDQWPPAAAAGFLRELKRYMEEPYLLLL